MGIIADKLGTTRGAIAGVIGRQRKKGIVARQIQPKFRKSCKSLMPRVKPQIAIAEPHVVPQIGPQVPRLSEPDLFKPIPIRPTKKKRMRLRMIENETEVTMKELQPHHCKYPIGDPKLPDFRFCGCRRTVSSPYCEKHTLICLDPRYYKRGSR